MSSNDPHGDDPRPDRGKGEKPTRDAKGRWLPGHCPNPKGRPRKKPKVIQDRSDLRIFGNTLIDIVANGEIDTMDRRAALTHKMFESAMKGRVTMQKFLYQEFERNAERLAGLRLRYDRLMLDWVINNPDYTKREFEMPFEVEQEIIELRTLLSYYFPDQYSRDGVRPDDRGDDDDV